VRDFGRRNSTPSWLAQTYFRRDLHRAWWPLSDIEKAPMLGKPNGGKMYTLSDLDCPTRWQSIRLRMPDPALISQ
jgi:hypothetical protein